MKRAVRKHWVDFLSIIGLAAVALGIGAYILENQRFRFPFIEEKPMVLKIELPNAQAVTPGQGQTVRVAGVQIGTIGKVELEDGVAVVDVEIEPRYDTMVRRDATALLRPRTALKDMFLEVDPGVGQPLEGGGRIPVVNTAQDVDPDEILEALDADTRDYLKLLVSGLGKGLDGRGNDLREAFRRLEPFHRDLAKVNRAVAARRGDLRRLIHDYGELTEELGENPRALTRLVRASNATLGAFASEDENISRTVSRLPGALRRSESTLGKVEQLGGELGPALDAIRPAFEQLDETNAAVRPFAREIAPVVRDQIRPFARRSRPFVEDLGTGVRDLAAAAPDLTKSFREVNRFFNIGAFNPGGAEALTGNPQQDRDREEGFLYWLAWVSQNGVSLFNTADAQGVFRRITACGASVGGAAEMLAPALTELGALQPDLPLGEIATDIANSGFGTCVF